MLFRSRRSGEPVLVNFSGALHERKAPSGVVANPGYSPYEQYSGETDLQGPWSDVYALGAVMYLAVAGSRPPDATSRVIADRALPSRDVAHSSYRADFLLAIDQALKVNPADRPQSIPEWRKMLLGVNGNNPASSRLSWIAGLAKRTK